MEYYSIEECCEILDSKRVPITGKDRIAGPYPYYGANGIQDYVADYIFDEELVLIAEDGGHFGSKDKPIAYRVSGKCWVNNHAHVLRAKDMIDIDYLCYSLMFYNVGNIVNGATRQKLNQKQLRLMTIPKISLDAQKEIVKKLSNIATIKENRKQQIDLYDDLINSRFVEMFGDPSSNDKNWKIQTFDDITTIVTYGLTVRPEFIEYGIDLISAREIRSGVVEYGKSPKISRDDFAELSEKAKPKKDEILLSKTGSIGHCALITSDREFAVTQNAARLGFELDKVNPWWVLYYIKTDYIQQWCNNQAKGNAVRDFQIQDIKRIPVFDCDIRMQNKFAEFVQHVDKLKSEVQKSLDETQTLFDSLVQEYFE
jgi:type I restriction enzyme S subunit